MSVNFDPNSAEYWDPQATRKEIDRVFDICYGCTLCHTLCPSFVSLFQFMDENFGEPERLSDTQVKQVVDECYQCKLCIPICPYIPPHEWMIDFPRMIMRANLVQAKRDGVPFSDKIFGDTDRVGSLASLAAPLVNWMNQSPFFRGLLEKYLGVHKDRLLPTYHSETFEKWVRKQPVAAKGKSEEKVALFFTCTVNYNEPDIGKAAMAVFEKNGIECQVPRQQCCGLPFLDVGMVPEAKQKIEENVAELSKAVKQGYKVVVPSASCSFMIKEDYTKLVPSDDCKLVAENTMDLSEYLVSLHKKGKLDLGFSEQIGKVRYHQPCHLKAQNIGFKAQELLSLIPGAEVKRMQCCSGHDGSWSVKKEYFEASMKVGKPLFKFMKADEEACMASDCPLSAIQVQQATGKKPIHPIEVLAKAYGLGAGKGS